MKKLLFTLMVCITAVFSSSAWTVSFTNPDGWGTVYIWAWNNQYPEGKNFLGVDWPGKTMTKDPNTNLWTYTGDDAKGVPTQIIFNAGNGQPQTGNLDFQEGATYDNNGPVGAQKYLHTVYFRDDYNWGTVYVYAWGGSAPTSGFPGDKLSKNDQGLYVWTVETTSQASPQFTGFLFDNGSNAKQTPNITNYVEGAIYLPDGTYEGEVVETVYYILGANINGAEDWDFGHTMTKQSDGTYKWEGTELGSGFKFTDAPNWSNGNYGSNGSPLQLNVPYEYEDGSSENIVFETDIIVTNPVVVLDPSAGTVTVTGEVEEIDWTTAEAYVTGDFNDWNGSDPAYKLTNEGTETGNWSGTFNLEAGQQFQIVIAGTWYGSTSGNVNVNLSNGAQTLSLNKGYDNNYVLSPVGGKINFQVSRENMQVIVQEVTDQNAYLIGAFSNWEAMEEYKMDNEGDGFYTISQELQKGEQFQFIYKEVVYGCVDGEEYVNANVGEAELPYQENGGKWTLATNGGALDFTLTLEDELFIVENPTPATIPANLYLIGDVTEVNGTAVANGMDYSNPIVFNNSQDSGVFSLENVVLEGEDGMASFAFLDMKGELTTLENLYCLYATSGDGEAVPEQENALAQFTVGSEKLSVLPNGTYNINVNFNDMTFTPVRIWPGPEALNLVGDIFASGGVQLENNGWNPEQPVVLKNNNDGTFSVEGVQFYGNGFFRFYDIIGNWETVHGQQCCYIPVGENISVTIDEPLAFQLGQAGAETNFQVAQGVYDILVDFNTMEITLTASQVEALGPKRPATIPEELYIVGTVGGMKWQPENALPAVKGDTEGVFTFSNIKFDQDNEGDDNAYFSFINVQTNNWDIINDGDHRYGPFSENQQVGIGVPASLYESTDYTWTIVPGAYDITVDFNTLEATFTETAAEQQDYTIYAYNNTEWSQLYLYVWGYTEAAGNWPGTVLSTTETVNGVKYYKYTFQSTVGSIQNLIFHANATENNIELNYKGGILPTVLYLNVTEEGVEEVDPETFQPVVPPTMVTYPIYVYNSTDWDKVYLYVTDAEDAEYLGEFPGITSEETEEVNDNEFILFEVEIPEGTEVSLIFSDGTKDGEVEAFEYLFSEEDSLYVELTNEEVKEIDPETFQPVVPPTMVTYPIYVYNSTDWDKVYLYVTDGEETEYLGEFPGITSEETEEFNDNEFIVFEVEIPAGTEVSLIFSDGTKDGEVEAFEYLFEDETPLYVELTNEEVKEIDPATFKPSTGNGGSGDDNNGDNNNGDNNNGDDNNGGDNGDEDGPTSAVDSLEISNDAVIYTLKGVRVNRNKLNKGIYIIDGKKVMVK